MKKLTVVIHSYNSEKDINECIDSAKLLTKEILVVDMESTDKTVSLAKEKDARVISIPFTGYVEPAREFGIRKAESEWVFILDTDERIPKSLSEEVKEVINQDTYSHYKVPRQEFFARTIWLKHGGWWPNYIIRLIHLPEFKNWPKAIHSTPEMEGKVGYLSHALLHYSKNRYEDMVNKTIVFEDMESDLLAKAGKPVGQRTFFRKFLGELNRRLVKNKGYLDGPIGIIESIYQAFSKTITYLYLYEKKNQPKNEANSTL